MSVSILAIRSVEVLQVSSWLDVDYSEYYRLTPTSFIELVSTGWENGSRTRVKRIQSLPRVFAYLNKLSIHGYLNDDFYAAAWSMCLCLQDNLEDIGSQVTRKLLD